LFVCCFAIRIIILLREKIFWSLVLLLLLSSSSRVPNDVFVFRKLRESTRWELRIRPFCSDDESLVFSREPIIVGIIVFVLRLLSFLSSPVFGEKILLSQISLRFQTVPHLLCTIPTITDGCDEILLVYFHHRISQK